VFRSLYEKSAIFFKRFDSVVLFFLRAILAWGFFNVSIVKWEDMGAFAEWLATMDIPMPLLISYLTATIEIFGAILLVTGVLVRLTTLPLIVIMIGAIFFIHLENGFACSNNGVEIPLYYLIMLLVLLTQGGGKWSLEYLIFKKSDGSK